eukprot:TRINITY_DN49072_c0_g1_i1.p1 TRINITY_DN49072_c0_g1~~TRINITY_DN49072_c0_g1_i1.p1  ORF type:complete len:727 (+),score=81.12 TRINITY_DN49072_c0_g1_i1:43-2223(+)
MLPAYIKMEPHVLTRLLLATLILAPCLSAIYAPGRIDCDTWTCSKHDNWTKAEFANSSDLCQSSQVMAMDYFGNPAPNECRYSFSGGFGVWRDCKKRYCKMYENIVSNLSHFGGPLYYESEGDECKPLLMFNRTLCETSYRDAEAFCECFCPMFHHLEQGSRLVGCESKIMAFLLFGRKGIKLSEKYALSPYCARLFCNWMTKLGDPEPPPNLVIKERPAFCKTLALPWRTFHCLELMSRQPYNPAPFDKPYPEPNMLECSDRSTHKVDIRHADTWSVCSDRNYRWKCPKNFPVMCKDIRCSGDHCCKEAESECFSGKKRAPSVLLSMQLPEWIGLLSPEMEAAKAPTTTPGPYEIFLSKLPTTTPGPSIVEQIRGAVPFMQTFVIIGGGVCIAMACLYVGRTHTTIIKKTVLGVSRVLSIYKSDPVSVFPASGNLPRDKKREAPLPPLRPQAEIEAEQADLRAAATLKEAWLDAMRYGMRHVVTHTGMWPLPEIEPLKQAISAARYRGIEDNLEVAANIEAGERWMCVMEAEYALVKATEESKPELFRVGMRKMTESPNPGMPWQATTLGRLTESEDRKASWTQLERLAAALQAAKGTGASERLVRDAKNLYSELVARTRDLPSDRCVLDPEGEGIKLLPMGHQRAVWTTSGEAYMYNARNCEAGELDEMPPREMLGDVAVDDARPVCAEYAKYSRCKAGRQCPWRHCKPQAGDQIKECLIEYEM